MLCSTDDFTLDTAKCSHGKVTRTAQPEFIVLMKSCPHMYIIAGQLAIASAVQPSNRLVDDSLTSR